MTINYKTILSNLQKGGKPCYYCKPINAGTKTLKECASEVAKAINMSVPFTKVASGIVLEKMIEKALEGYRVETENISIYVTARGGATTANSKWDSDKNTLHLAINLKGDLKAKLDAIEFVNTTEGVSISLYSVGDDEWAEDGVIAGTASSVVKFAGEGLNFDSAASDEGVWLCDSEKTIIEKLTASSKTDQTINVTLAETIPTGNYYFMVASRNGEADKGVAVAYKKCEVKGAM